MSEIKYTYYLSLGSNLGLREQTLRRAVALIGERAGRVCAESSLFYSEPWGFQSEHGFCNQCIALESDLAPLDLLHLTQQIERELGRTHKTHTDAHHCPLTSYSDRVIDIDLLECFNQATSEPITSSTKELTLPHPLMTKRDFVMIPLSEIKEQENK